MAEQTHRVERDSIGEVKVPKEALLRGTNTTGI